MGENLTVSGRLLPQPKLLYAKKNVVVPKNGNFRSGNTFSGSDINLKILFMFMVKEINLI